MPGQLNLEAKRDRAKVVVLAHKRGGFVITQVRAEDAPMNHQAETREEAIKVLTKLVDESAIEKVLGQAEEFRETHFVVSKCLIPDDIVWRHGKKDPAWVDRPVGSRGADAGADEADEPDLFEKRG
jgi:hypothetical protein